MNRDFNIYPLHVFDKRTYTNRTGNAQLIQAKEDYQYMRSIAARFIRESGNERERIIYTEILDREHTFFNSADPQQIDIETYRLEEIRLDILNRIPEYLAGAFDVLICNQDSMTNQFQAMRLIKNGRQYLKQNAWIELVQVIRRLTALLP